MISVSEVRVGASVVAVASFEDDRAAGGLMYGVERATAQAGEDLALGVLASLSLCGAAAGAFPPPLARGLLGASADVCAGDTEERVDSLLASTTDYALCVSAGNGLEALAAARPRFAALGESFGYSSNVSNAETALPPPAGSCASHGANAAPRARDDDVSTYEGVPVTVHVTANDFDGDADELKVLSAQVLSLIHI